MSSITDYFEKHRRAGRGKNASNVALIMVIFFETVIILLLLSPR
jgi:hypothetical protein